MCNKIDKSSIYSASPLFSSCFSGLGRDISIANLANITCPKSTIKDYIQENLRLNSFPEVSFS